MSALSGLAGANGRIVTAALAPASYFRAMGFTASGALAVTGAVGGNFNGSVRVNGGQVVHSLAAPITHYASGLPLGANGELCTESANATRYDQGVGFTAAGRVAIL